MVPMAATVAAVPQRQDADEENASLFEPTVGSSEESPVVATLRNNGEAPTMMFFALFAAEIAILFYLLLFQNHK